MLSFVIDQKKKKKKGRKEEKICRISLIRRIEEK
jgi:hypothetical protein